MMFFLAIASWPRMLIEVFTRRKFGERYFSTATAVTLAVILFFIPVVMVSIPFFSRNLDYNDRGLFSIIWNNLSWYIYLGAFIYFSWKRRQEVAREPSVFNFSRFSLSTGEIHPKLLELKFGNQPLNHRLISTVVEPGIFLIAGCFLLGLKQPVGLLLIYTSICYSLSWAGAYYLGDQFIMDTIDEMIANEEMVDAFVENKPASETRGFQTFCKKPTEESFRRQVVDQIIVEDDVSEAF